MDSKDEEGRKSIESEKFINDLYFDERYNNVIIKFPPGTKYKDFKEDLAKLGLIFQFDLSIINGISAFITNGKENIIEELKTSKNLKISPCRYIQGPLYFQEKY